MANLFDYLFWRGDLRLQQDPFNEVDNLVLATLSYLDFSGIIDSNFRQSLTLAQAAKRYQQLHSQDKRPNHGMNFIRNNQRLLAEAAQSVRFGDALVLGYMDRLDMEETKQFAAVTFVLSDGTAYLSFRGTDDTIIGWKEDFKMAFLPQIPSQADAVVYLEHAAAALEGGLRLGGHSKGGNLAVYAAVFAVEATQNRVLQIYNNDGPGFSRTVLESAGYQNLLKRIVTYVPQSSIVGMLLEHEEAYIVVHSNQMGIMQHDFYSWAVERNRFICLDTVTESSRFLDRTVRDWLMVIGVEERAVFLDTLFEILEATGARNRAELTAQWHKNAIVILKSLKHIDEPTKEMMQQVLSCLWEAAKKNLYVMQSGRKRLPLSLPLNVRKLPKKR